MHGSRLVGGKKQVNSAFFIPEIGGNVAGAVAIVYLDPTHIQLCRLDHFFLRIATRLPHV